MQCHHVNLSNFGVMIVGVKSSKVLAICEDSTCFTIQCIQYVDIEIPLSCIILLHRFLFCISRVCRSVLVGGGILRGIDEVHNDCEKYGSLLVMSTSNHNVVAR